MPVLADSYIPSQPGAQVRDFLGAYEGMSSLMERKQRLAMAQEQQQMERDKFVAMLPAIAAKREADIASAKAAVANAQIEQQLRARAANESPALNAEYLAAVQIPDFDAQSRTLAGLQAKVSYLSVLPEYKGFVDTVNDARAKAFLNGQTNLKLEQAQQIAREQIAGRVDAAKELGATRVELEGIKTSRAKEIEDMRATHRQELEGVKSEFSQKNTNNRVVTAGAYKDNTAKVNLGIEAKPAISQIGTALTLLDDPEVRSGTGANFELKARRLGNLLGANYEGVQKTEQLQTILGQTVLEKARGLKGAISDKDIVFLERVSPDLTKSPDGNKKILLALRKGYENSVAVAQMISDMRSEGATEPEINNAVTQYALNNSIWDNASTAQPAATADGVTSQGWTPDKQKRLDELKAKLGK